VSYPPAHCREDNKLVIVCHECDLELSSCMLHVVELMLTKPVKKLLVYY